MPTTDSVVQVTSADTYDLRLRVLRTGTPTKDLDYAQDRRPGTVHLGLRRAGVLVAVSTWTPEPWRDAADRAAIRLRGMAVEPALQGTGAGGVLVRAGLERAWAAGAELVWASARDSALGFYERLGFTVIGDTFTDATTALPHHWIVLPASQILRT